MNVNEKPLLETAEKIYLFLVEKGMEVLLDDRDERAGVKFKDADLIGIPFRVTIGPQKLSEGKVEIRDRRSGEVKTLTVSEVEAFLMERISEKCEV